MKKKIISYAIPIVIGIALGLGSTWLSGSNAHEHSDSSIMHEVASILIMLVALFIAAYLQIILHEAGHLVCGLASGYRFVSFRVGSFTLIKSNGKLQLKRFKLAGTGGQCLMAPPSDVQPVDIPTIFYNAGGVLMNLVTATLALVLLLTCKNSMPLWLIYFLGSTVVIGYAMALLNGLPLKIGGVANDGHNMLHLGKNKMSVKGFYSQLVINEKMQNGERMSLMPEELFDLGGEIDYSDALQANVELMHIGRVLDQGHIDQAHNMLKEIITFHGHEMLPLLRFEAQSELIFTSLATGDIEQAMKLTGDKQLMSYITRHARVMTSKQRIVMAKTLILDGNRDEAQHMLDQVIARRNSFLMQGEVESDIELMMQLLNNKNIKEITQKSTN